MFILEEPYVSDLLIRTVVDLEIPVLDTPIARRSLSGETALRLELPESASALLLSDADFAAGARCAGARLYSNSEHSIGWIARHLTDTRLPDQIALFKDKVAFRDLLCDLYPDYRYHAVDLADLSAFDPTRLRTPFVLKPAVGFFSMCVHVVPAPEQWPATVSKVQREVAAFRQTYPGSVLNLDRFIVEEVIEGEEVAVDAYFDTTGTPLLVNLYVHQFSSSSDVGDRLYVTNPETVARLGPPALDFLDALGARVGLTDFPVHVELRIDVGGRVAPIEVNPMRFGGWCATDLAQYAYGLNPYRAYVLDEPPDWTCMSAFSPGRTTALIVADLPSSLDLSRIESVDCARFASRFSDLHELRPMDHTRFPVFAFAFASVPTSDQSELQAVLGADLREYVTMRRPGGESAS